MRTLSICSDLSVMGPLLMAISYTVSTSIIGQVIIGMSKGVATLSICNGLSVMSPLLMVVSYTLSISIIGQVMIGMSIGVAASTVLIYVYEVSPSEIKGRIIVLTEFSVMLKRGK
jgi:predicted MFS family arabinose efflux permease